MQICYAVADSSSFFRKTIGDDGATVDPVATVSSLLVDACFYQCDLHKSCEMVAKYRDAIGCREIFNAEDVLTLGRPADVWTKVAYIKTTTPGIAHSPLVVLLSVKILVCVVSDKI